VWLQISKMLFYILVAVSFHNTNTILSLNTSESNTPEFSEENINLQLFVKPIGIAGLILFFG